MADFWQGTRRHPVRALRSLCSAAAYNTGLMNPMHPTSRRPKALILLLLLGAACAGAGLAESPPPPRPSAAPT